MTSFLLDTHIWIWMLEASDRLRPRMRRLISDDAHDLKLSMASIWEISIKLGAGRLELPLRGERDFQEQLSLTRVDLVPITLAHALTAGSLPRHHSDPFDRMIVAQAQDLGIPLISVDPHLSRYDVEVITD